MAVKLKAEDNPKKFVLAKDLKDGQIGIVVDSMYTGRILQKFNEEIVSIGMPHGNGFSNECTLEVRILEKGELIEVV